MQTTGEILHILFVLGLPTLALVGIGVWALKREARGAAARLGICSLRQVSFSLSTLWQLWSTARSHLP